MRCSKCGAENPDRARFCVECASPFARRCSSFSAEMLGIPAHEAPRSALFLIGTPAQCIEELNRRAKDWGVGQFIFLGGAPETTRRLANEVPQFGP